MEQNKMKVQVAKLERLMKDAKAEQLCLRSYLIKKFEGTMEVEYGDLEEELIDDVVMFVLNELGL